MVRGELMMNVRQLEDNKIETIRYSIQSSTPRLKTLSESESRGVNKYVESWYGFDLWISNPTLALISGGSGFTATILGVWVPEPAVSKVLATCLAFCGMVTGYLASEYPNGVIISSVFVPGTGSCIPYNIQSQ